MTSEQEAERDLIAATLQDRPDLKELLETARDADPADVRHAADMLKGGSELGKAFYTVPEAAELLGVHPNTIYHLEQRREIEYYKPGNKIEIPAAEIERLKRERKS